MKEVLGINYLCVYAMLEMALRDIGEREWDQIRLANQFGVTLLPGNTIKGVINVRYCTDERECGAHINIEDLNTFFSMKKIPLKALFLKANPYACYSEAEEDDTRNYIIYLYSYGSLNEDRSKLNVGHASMRVDNIKDGEVSIYDPGPLKAGIKVVKLNRLYDAIDDCKGGILILERIFDNE